MPGAGQGVAGPISSSSSGLVAARRDIWSKRLSNATVSFSMGTTTTTTGSSGTTMDGSDAAKSKRRSFVGKSSSRAMAVAPTVTTATSTSIASETVNAATAVEESVAATNHASIVALRKLELEEHASKRQRRKTDRVLLGLPVSPAANTAATATATSAMMDDLSSSTGLHKRRSDCTLEEDPEEEEDNHVHTKMKKSTSESIPSPSSSAPPHKRIFQSKNQKSNANLTVGAVFAAQAAAGAFSVAMQPSTTAESTIASPPKKRDSCNEEQNETAYNLTVAVTTSPGGGGLVASRKMEITRRMSSVGNSNNNISPFVNRIATTKNPATTDFTTILRPNLGESPTLPNNLFVQQPWPTAPAASPSEAMKPSGVPNNPSLFQQPWPTHGVPPTPTTMSSLNHQGNPFLPPLSPSRLVAPTTSTTTSSSFQNNPFLHPSSSFPNVGSSTLQNNPFLSPAAQDTSHFLQPASFTSVPSPLSMVAQGFPKTPSSPGLVARSNNAAAQNLANNPTLQASFSFLPPKSPVPVPVPLSLHSSGLVKSRGQEIIEKLSQSAIFGASSDKLNNKISSAVQGGIPPTQGKHDNASVVQTQPMINNMDHPGILPIPNSGQQHETPNDKLKDSGDIVKGAESEKLQAVGFLLPNGLSSQNNHDENNRSISVMEMHGSINGNSSVQLMRELWDQGTVGGIANNSYNNQHALSGSIVSVQTIREQWDQGLVAGQTKNNEQIDQQRNALPGHLLGLYNTTPSASVEVPKGAHGWTRRGHGDPVEQPTISKVDLHPKRTFSFEKPKLAVKNNESSGKLNLSKDAPERSNVLEGKEDEGPGYSDKDDEVELTTTKLSVTQSVPKSCVNGSMVVEKAARTLQKFMQEATSTLVWYRSEKSYWEVELQDIAKRRQEELEDVQRFIELDKQQIMADLHEELAVSHDESGGDDGGEQESAGNRQCIREHKELLALEIKENQELKESINKLASENRKLERSDPVSRVMVSQLKGKCKVLEEEQVRWKTVVSAFNLARSCLRSKVSLIDRAAVSIQKFMKEVTPILSLCREETLYWEEEKQDIERRRQEELEDVQMFIKLNKQQIMLELHPELASTNEGESQSDSSKQQWASDWRWVEENKGLLTTEREANAQVQESIRHLIFSNKKLEMEYSGTASKNQVLRNDIGAILEQRGKLMTAAKSLEQMACNLMASLPAKADNEQSQSGNPQLDKIGGSQIESNGVNSIGSDQGGSNDTDDTTTAAVEEGQTGGAILAENGASVDKDEAARAKSQKRKTKNRNSYMWQSHLVSRNSAPSLTLISSSIDEEKQASGATNSYVDSPPKAARVKSLGKEDSRWRDVTRRLMNSTKGTEKTHKKKDIPSTGGHLEPTDSAPLMALISGAGGTGLQQRPSASNHDKASRKHSVSHHEATAHDHRKSGTSTPSDPSMDSHHERANRKKDKDKKSATAGKKDRERDRSNSFHDKVVPIKTKKGARGEEKRYNWDSVSNTADSEGVKTPGKKRDKPKSTETKTVMGASETDTKAVIEASETAPSSTVSDSEGLGTVQGSHGSKDVPNANYAWQSHLDSMESSPLLNIITNNRSQLEDAKKKSRMSVKKPLAS